jgi:transglutaminase-like putative cysteine protease
MRLLTVRHITTYHYSEPVVLGEHRMMFRPRESHDLRLLTSRLEIRPKPAHLRFLHDVFDNSVGVVRFAGPTAELRFESNVTLEHYETSLPDYPLEEFAERYPFRYSDEEFPNLSRALMQHYPSEEVKHWVRQFLNPSGTTGTMDLLQRMTLAIKQDFAYTRRTQKGVQNPAETLQTRCGSCRDFAVLTMEAARSLGLAARFVSGYIFIPGSSKAVTGGGATHAWMQVYLPGAGWIDFDPTNSIVGNRNLIRVAMAWDHPHVLPLWGTFIGKASSFLDMDVAVSVTEEIPEGEETDGQRKI